MPPDPAGSARPARRPTIADIARSAGVSKSAVSYALNGQQGISPATAERILAVANDLGWRPNRAARSLRAATAGACGVVLAGRPSVHPFRPYFFDLFSGIEGELSSRRPGTSPVTVQVSADGNSWTSVRASISIRTARGLLHTLNVSGLSDANFVRLVLAPGGDRAGLARPEIGRVALRYALPLVVDDETSWSSAYAYSGGGALAFDTSNPQYFGGDASRVERVYGSPFIEWQLPAAATAFQATAFYWPSQAVQPFTVEVSADGSTWSTVSPVISGGTGNWLAYTYTLYNLSGVNYVQIVWPGVPAGGQSFTPELGDVDIYGATG